MTEENEGKTRGYRYDVILISLLLAIALLAVGILLLTRRGGAYAVVELDGKRIAEYPLTENREYSLNGGSNILVIEDGAAYMIEADCPDGVCVNTGRIKYVGESIICLPNRISVTIEGADDGIDVVS